jgi:hypothetical protein
MAAPEFVESTDTPEVSRAIDAAPADGVTEPATTLATIAAADACVAASMPELARGARTTGRATAGGTVSPKY